MEDEEGEEGALELELEEHSQVFDDARARQELHRQMSRLSPRRTATTDESFATTTLQFYQDISPSSALEHLFEWFRPAAGVASATSSSSPPAPNTIGLDEFNRLRRCLGKSIIVERDWNRALEELAERRDDARVAQKDFKALFGPEPFFGSENVQGIVREVMKCEETLHFTQMLVNQFGVDGDSESGSMPDPLAMTDLAPQKVIGLQELRNIQQACCVDVPIYDAVEWTDVCKKLQLPEDTKYLNWMQFAEVFTVTVKGKRVFTPHADSMSVVYAVLANENVLATIKDPEEDNVSRKAFTNLLRLQSQKVDDDVWLDLLQNMKTTYNYRGRKMARRNSAADGDSSDALHGHEQPLVVVRNTENQVLSYDIVFTELGDIGITLQSDFYGHCLTVSSKEGPAELYSVIEKDDIVAAVNDVSLISDTPARDKDEEGRRLARGKALLDENKVRKVTFYRQESYFRYDPSTKAVTLFLKTIMEVAPDGVLIVKRPNGLPWKSGAEDEYTLKLRFDIPQLSDFERATAVWDASGDSIRVGLDGETGVAEGSTLVFDISGVDCGSDVVFGPCELSEGDSPVTDDTTERVSFVSLYTNWRYRETSLGGNPIRERADLNNEYFDTSLQPLGKDFHAGDSGLTIGSDFYGQCPIVTRVKKLSAASELDVRPQDILSSIISLGASGEASSLNQLNCIKPFMLSKSEAEKHLKDVQKQLTTCHKSGRPYHLQFLRINSFFFHEDGRTTFTFSALTTLSKRTALTIKMPSAKWFVSGNLTTKVLGLGVKVLETFWDSQLHSLRLILDECEIPEATSVTIEILGITSSTKRGGKQLVKFAGPSEVVGLRHGSASYAPEMAFELHEHWHSYLVGHQGLEVSKVADTLKRFKTSPAMLWEVLEYTSRLFELMKAPGAEALKLPELNRLITIVCGDERKMNAFSWNELCRNLGAKSFSGLSRRQFACCWNDIVGLSNHRSKDVYMHLETARKLFDDIIHIFQSRGNPELMGVETIERLMKIAGFPESMTVEALNQLQERGLDGWDYDFFAQIICGGNPSLQFEENGSSLWLKLSYAQKLFAQFSNKNVMKKKNLNELLIAAKILQPKLTNDLWSSVCESVGLDDNGALHLNDFIEIYSGDLLGPRHALADYYRIETFKLLPERRAKEIEVSKEAVMSVAPEKVNVKDVAAKALEETASAEELFQELRAQNLEFSKLDKIEEKEEKNFVFTSDFSAKRLSRERGFLHIQLRSITELADRLIHKNSSFNKDEAAEELYAMIQVTDASGLKFNIPELKQKGLCDRVREQLFGEKDGESVYEVTEGERWHERTQKVMRELHTLDEELTAATPQSPEYDEILKKIKAGEDSIRPGGKLGNVEFDGRIFSSIILRNPSPDALIRFPDDQFRLFVDYPDLERSPRFVVCKLFKRIGSAKSRHELNLGFAKDALRKAEMTYAILKDLVEQQEKLLRLTVAEEHAKGKNAAGDNRIWTAVSKLKQKRQDLLEFELEVAKQRDSVQKIQSDMDKALQLEKTPGVKVARPSVLFERTPELSGGATAEMGNQDEQKLKNAESEPVDSSSIRFIGQAFFELRELMRVLHDDAEDTEDIATFVTEHHMDVGVLLLHFKYKCESMQAEANPVELSSLTIRMAENDSNVVTKSEEAFQYPSHAHLQLAWRINLLRVGDRFCIVREGDPYKLAMPYFLMLWNKVGLSSDGGSVMIGECEGDDEPPVDEEKRLCNWWIPELLAKFYGSKREPMATTTISKRSGYVRFPSALDLSLPPGVYRIYLLRNETEAGTGKKFRVTLGRTAPLAVLPGVNSVHTSFGTTPLIDVKPLSVSMHVFCDADRGEMEQSLQNQDGFYDEKYEHRFAIEQELEVTMRDIKLKQIVVDKSKDKNVALVQEIADLQAIVDKLNDQKRMLEEEDKTNVLSSVNAVVARSQPSLNSSDPVVFSYRFRGGAPRKQDRIVVLPADIVRVSDFLRSTILGKLQSNDPQQVLAVRKILERELGEVAQIFDMSFSCESIYRLITRKAKQFFGIGSGAGLKDKSDAYKIAAGVDDGDFVMDECMKAYSTAPPIARSNFHLIIRDLIEEVEVRRPLLKSPDNENEEGTDINPLETRRLGKTGALMTIGLELKVNEWKGDTTKEIIAEKKTVLGRRFCGGGFYVAKYIRRIGGDDYSRLARPDETGGELCRYGPFYIEPALFQWSIWQIMWVISKTVRKMLQSDQGKLAIKICGHWVLAGLKYVLAVISLSFNLSVLADGFHVDMHEMDRTMSTFREKMSNFFGPVEIALGAVHMFFDIYVGKLIAHLDIFQAAGECYSGVFLYAVLFFLILATFIVYVVVQEDMLLKVQKLDMYLPFNPGKSALGMLEHIGALLVIPLYLSIKSCVLFISRHWKLFYRTLGEGIPVSFEMFHLYNHPTPICPSATTAQINYGIGISAIVLIVMFLFACLPLLLLDLYSWVPLKELTEKEKLHDLAHSSDRQNIRDAIHSNADLVEVPNIICTRRYLKPGLFQRCYKAYKGMSFRELQKKYGLVQLFGMFVFIYIVLMTKSISRGFGALLGWRSRGGYMYKSAAMKPRSSWRVVDWFCVGFNAKWKVQYIKDKIVMPLVNIALVTVGLWGENQWQEFNIEDRANDCYKMEPSGEIKQLQMMTLHGKIVSLFWLCVPDTVVLAYLAEVLNRGPIFSYFLNKKFLQADIPESERDKDPVWRFHSALRFAGEEDEVVYLSDTRFYGTVIKWGSAMVEIVSLLAVYGAKDKSFLLGMALITSVVAPVLELNQQIIKAYVDYVESVESLVNSTGLASKAKALKNAFDTAQDALDDAPGLTINTGAVARRRSLKKRRAAAAGNPATADTPGDSAMAAMAERAGPSVRLGSTQGAGNVASKVQKDTQAAVEDVIDNNTVGAAVMEAAQTLIPKKQLVVLNALPQVTYVVLTDALDVGEGEITVSWNINARQRFHALDAIGMFPARAPGDFTIRTMDQCICYRLLKESNAEQFGWKSRKHDDKEFARQLIVSRAESLRNFSEREATKITKKSMRVMLSSNAENGGSEDPEETARKLHEAQLQKAGATISGMLESPKLKPYKKKLPEILADEVAEHGLQQTVLALFVRFDLQLF